MALSISAVEPHPRASARCQPLRAGRSRCAAVGNPHKVDTGPNAGTKNAAPATNTLHPAPASASASCPSQANCDPARVAETSTASNAQNQRRR